MFRTSTNREGFLRGLSGSFHEDSSHDVICSFKETKTRNVWEEKDKAISHLWPWLLHEKTIIKLPTSVFPRVNCMKCLLRKKKVRLTSSLGNQNRIPSHSQLFSQLAITWSEAILSACKTIHSPCADTLPHRHTLLSAAETLPLTPSRSQQILCCPSSQPQFHQ